MKPTLLCALLLAAANAAADPHTDLVGRAFAAIATDFEETWAYTETAVEQGVETVGRYDPRRPREARWTLLSVDGRPPTGDEQREYRERQTGHGATGDDDGGADIVEPGSLELLEETPDAWIYAFKPVEDGEDGDMMRHVTGRLTIRKSGPYVSSMALSNEKPIRPIPGVKIKEFRTRLEFAPATDGGPIVPRSIDVRVRGGAFLAVRFDETESVRFSAWEYAGEE
jgi:hypothetical protein